MAKLNNLTSYRKQSRQHKRFYTQLDMSIIRHDLAVQNARIKRGELSNKGNHYIAECGCGIEGCFLYGSHDNRSDK